MQLQRLIGNHAVGQLLHQGATPQAQIQRNPVKDRLVYFMRNQSQGKGINALAGHILTIINAMEAGNFALADKMLKDKAVPRLVGHTIRVTSQPPINVASEAEIGPEVEKKVSTGIAWYFSDSKKIEVPEFSVMINNDYMTGRSPADDPALARMVLPVVLEEWIHMFQHQIKGFLSEGTEKFSRTAEVRENQRLPDGEGRWNLREVDIYAIYRDLGWASVLDAFRSRYTEREKYEAFKQLPPKTRDQIRAENLRNGVILGSHRR
jgi:hypothetical protein